MPPAAGPNGSVTWRRADLLDRSARRHLVDEADASHLLHLAWCTEPGRYWEAPENDDWLDASRDLIDYFRDAGGRRVVTAGTCAEYDWRDPALRDGFCREAETSGRPHSRLGRCKLALGRWLDTEAGISAAHARVFFAYGAGEAPGRLVPSLITRLLHGEPAETGPGNLVRDFLDGRDIAAALVALLGTDIAGAVNIGGGSGLSIAALAAEVARQIGRPDLLRVGALPGRAGDPPRLVADPARLRDEVGFRPGIALADGLATTIAWWRREIAGAGA